MAVIRQPGGQEWDRILRPLEDDDTMPKLVATPWSLDCLAGAEVTVLHATNLPGPADLQKLDMHAMAEREHRPRRRLRGHVAATRHLEFAMRPGAAAVAIVQMQARSHADLVVTGSRGRGSLARRILGWTSADMIRRIDADLPCTLLTQD